MLHHLETTTLCRELDDVKQLNLAVATFRRREGDSVPQAGIVPNFSFRVTERVDSRGRVLGFT